MAADREVAVDAALTQVPGERLESVDVELEDQGEADDDRVEAPDDLEHLVGRSLELDHLDVVAELLEGRAR